jgi:hypothetical protein
MQKIVATALTFILAASLTACGGLEKSEDNSPNTLCGKHPNLCVEAPQPAQPSGHYEERCQQVWAPGPDQLFNTNPNDDYVTKCEQIWVAD